MWIVWWIVESGKCMEAYSVSEQARWTYWLLKLQGMKCGIQYRRNWL